MRSIEYKSTGTLIGELITTKLKIQNIGPKEEFIERDRQLWLVLEKVRDLPNKYDKISTKYDELEIILTSLWWEQEILYIYRKYPPFTLEDYKACAQAGINSLVLNAQRSELIREIDKALGEESTTFLEKSFK